MQIRYKDGEEWLSAELPTECPLCGGSVEKNQWKKEDKHPDYKCNNKDCRCGFWIPKPKKPTHQLQPTASNTAELVMLNSILAELKNISELLKPTHL
jgi:hypothetical protein